MVLTFNSNLYDDKFMIEVRKKPVIVKAIQVTEDFEVETMEGTMKGKKDDYLLRGVRGELYAVDKEIFKETYEVVTNGS